AIDAPNRALVEHLLSFDTVIVAGEAKSHCVEWTVEDLLSEIRARDASLARRIVLLDDCASPVVVPGVVDFTDAAEAAYERFAAAGMRRALSTDPTDGWL
ncbi:MAG: isochorismatase, partial [Gammaproteobacteria bacterium]|nr:isochorismatase [Gammaproteobacteria bacterium]